MKHSTSARRVLVAAALALPASALPPQGATVPYAEVSQRTQDFTNFNVETTRGMVLDGNTLWAINTHGSRLLKVDMTSPPFVPTSWPTLLNPIAVARWDDYVLVLGGGTHALAFHDPLTGDLVGLVDLGEDAPEPGDLVVDDRDDGLASNDVAYVSSMGKHQVVRIDLTSRAVDRTWPVQSLKPRFLYLDHGADGEDPEDNALYVAPLLSGNNSTVALRPGFAEEAMVVDLDGQAIELPDEDLFRIPEGWTDGTPAEPVFRRVSTILTAHGRNPGTGAYWMLSVDLNNKDEDGLGIDTEPELRGDFSDNRLTILPDPRGVSTLTDAFGATTVSLDEEFGLHASAIVASNPWDLNFTASGLAFVSSPTGDLVRVLGTAGQRLWEIGTGEGTIPRTTLLWQPSPQYSALLVYCWGTNEIRGFRFPNDPSPLDFTIDLGLDPTPPLVAEGRAIFYDAGHSEHSRSTCGTCHVGGEYDGLAWSLQDRPKDHKDVMVTQNLKSIADTFPFHWRGERRLSDFNGAFPGLLGADLPLTTGPGSEFDAFEAFVFSLQSMANPRANVRRELDDTLQGVGTPSDGQTTFLTKVTDGPFRCVDCHSLPNGTGNDFLQNPGDKATFMNFEVAHYRDLSWKDQDVLTVEYLDPYDEAPPIQTVQAERARGGFGVLHNGNVPNFAQLVENFRVAGLFIGDPPVPNPNAMTIQERDDITAFLRQFDRGLSKGVHKAYFLENGDAQAPAIESEITSVLLPQVTAGWLDVVALGVHPSAGTSSLAWHYDPGSGQFVADDASATSVGLSSFRTTTGAAAAIFGIPAGMGFYFSADVDHDGATGAAEATAGTDPFDPDTDGDGFPDGYELVHGSRPKLAASTPSETQAPTIVAFDKLYETTSLAVYRLEADEPVDYRVTWWPEADPQGDQGAFVRTVESPYPALVHTVVLQGMEYASASLVISEDQIHDIELEITDLSGNSTVDSSSYSVAPDPVKDIIPPFTSAVTKLELEVPATRNGGTIDLQVRAQAMYRAGVILNDDPVLTSAPLLQHRIIAQVLVEDILDTAEGDWIVSSSFDAKTATLDQHTSFYFDGVQYTALPGDFLVSRETDANGEVVFDFSQSGLAGGQKVALNIVAILPEAKIDQGNPGPNGEPNFVDGGKAIGLLALYKFAATAPELRCFVEEY